MLSIILAPLRIPIGGELLIPIIAIIGIGYGIYIIRKKK